jgi:putative membrane protein
LNWLAALELGVGKLIVRWLLSAIALLIVASVVPGFHVRGLPAALVAALIIGLVNGTLGLLLKVITLPFTMLTFGLFLLVINALMLEFSSWFVPGFRVEGFGPAFWGALVLSLINLAVRHLQRD